MSFREFLFSMIGFALIFRIGVAFLTNSKEIRTQKFGGFILFLLFHLFLIHCLRSFISVLLIELPILFFFSTFHLVQSHRNSFKINLMTAILCLDELILSMRTGKSLREALLFAGAVTPAARQYLKQAHHCLKFSKPPDFETQLERQVFSFIKSVDEAKLKSIERMKACRERLKTELIFRQKLRQIGYQSKTQAAVIVFLYISGCLFDLRQFGWTQSKTFIFLSLPLITLGCLLMLSLGKRRKWKT